MTSVLIGAGVFATVAAMVAAVVTVLMVRARVVVIRVVGPSMTPALRSGDRVLVRRGVGAVARAGDIVVLPEPGPCRRGEPAPGRPSASLIVKRVVAAPGDPLPDFLPPWERAAGVVAPGYLVLLGDNASMSRDSRHFGQVRAERLVGVVERRLGGHA